MDKSSEAFKELKTLVQQFSGTIGPEHILGNSKADICNFEDNLSCTRGYFYGGYFLREKVLEKIGCRKNETNHDFCYKLFHKIMSAVYRNVKDRNIPIEKTLNNYLTEVDFDFAAKRLEELLKSSKSKFKIILVSNLIELTDIEFLQIGNVVARKITKNYIDTFPEKIESTAALGGFLGIRSKELITRENFLDKYKDRVTLEVDVEGFHLEYETSPVFHLAIQKIRLFFAYLFVCKHFLENVVGKYEIEVKEIQKYSPFLSTEPLDLQEYYIRKKEDISYLKRIDTRWKKAVLSNKIFVLTKESLDKLSESCHLGNFNTMNKSHDYGEIKSKINRSLDWFLKAILEEDVTDSVISFFISLESLLSSPDPLTSHTDDMAENIAIMLTSNPDNRYKHKKTFKHRIYPLRNKIMHYGKGVSWDEDWENLNNLKIYIVFSILGILKRLESIREYGNSSKAMREFFEREKLKSGIVLSSLKIQDET